MRNLLLLAALTGGVAFATTGCQVSDHHRHVDASNRPADYTMPYRAVMDTQWKSSTMTGADSGTVAKGTRVRFDRTPNNTMSWQQVLMDDGSIKYVHPTDFEPVK